MLLLVTWLLKNISQLLEKLEFYYCVYKSRPILTETNSFHISIPHLFEVYRNIIAPSTGRADNYMKFAM
jgi:hypothetical protein